MLMILVWAIVAAGQPQSTTAVRDSYPHLSPDGRTLVFQSNRSGRNAIWIAAADGRDPQLLFDGGELGSDPGTPAWSSDGTSIAFAMKPGGATDENESEIYVMAKNGANVRRLTTAPGDDSHPYWSADGQRIFFNSARATPDLNADWSDQWIDIYSMSADGGDIQRHTHCKATCTYPVPSPDGKRVAHRRTLANASFDWAQRPVQRNSEVFVTNLDGSGSLNLSNSPAYDGWPNWSADGHWLFFASNRNQPPNVGQIFAAKIDGTGIRQITTGPLSRVQPRAAPDGKQLFFYENIETDDFEIGHIARYELSLPD